MKVGVFDSGLGGQSVANAIQAALPDIDILVREDKHNVPYGNKQLAELIKLVTPILQQMVSNGCQVVVIACNTVSTTIIKDLRATVDVPLIAMEPMIKPAAKATKNKTIAVCATPATLKSERYNYLKQSYAKDVQVIEPDCSGWSLMIESDQLDVREIAKQINTVLDQGADVIVLGCTHYHWIEHEIRVLCDERAIVLQPELPTIQELKRVLARLA